MPVLDDGHALDRALALHPDAVHVVAAAGAAQLAQAVEIGQGGHGALLPFDCPAEEGEALQVDVGQVHAQARAKICWSLDIIKRHKTETKRPVPRRATSRQLIIKSCRYPVRPAVLKSLHLSLQISRGCEGRGGGRRPPCGEDSKQQAAGMTKHSTAGGAE